eukprot:GSChrysophyteH1.ASY1.ANO1.1927.1 assembled CDS
MLTKLLKIDAQSGGFYRLLRFKGYAHAIQCYHTNSIYGPDTEKYTSSIPNRITDLLKHSSNDLVSISTRRGLSSVIHNSSDEELALRITAVEVARSCCDNILFVDKSYEGPMLPTCERYDVPMVTEEWVNDICQYMKELKGPIPKDYVMYILRQASVLHTHLPNVSEIEIPKKVTVVGDTHGQFFDLMNLLSPEVAGYPTSHAPFVFNGDFVDRGIYSFEVIFALLAMKIACPRSVHLIRGNHETTCMNQIYVFVCHGGLGKLTSNMTMMDMMGLNRFVEPDFPSAVSELLWSDPTEKNEGLSVNTQRGAGWQFGKDITNTFLLKNGFELLVRSHEVRQNGFSVGHEGRCITIFSAPNYCDVQGNAGSVLIFERNSEAESEDGSAPIITSVMQFHAVRHPFQRKS